MAENLTTYKETISAELVDGEGFDLNQFDSQNSAKEEGFEYKSLEEVISIFSSQEENWKINTSSSDAGELKKEGIENITQREWVYSGGEKSLTDSVKGTDESGRHTEILNDLYEKGWSVQEYLDKFSNTQVRDIYFADGKGKISFQTYKFDTKINGLENVYDTYPDDDDDYFTASQSITLKPKQTTFNLNSVFGSEEKTPTEAKAEAGAWESFWRDLLNEKPADQEIQDQPKDLFEIFRLKANLDNQKLPDKTAGPTTEANLLNLSNQESSALGPKELPAPVSIKAKVTASSIKILGQQAVPVSLSAREIIRIVDNTESAPLLGHNQVESAGFKQAERANLYIEDSYIEDSGEAIEEVKLIRNEEVSNNSAITILDLGSAKLQEDGKRAVGAQETVMGTEQAAERITVPIKAEEANRLEPITTGNQELPADLLDTPLVKPGALAGQGVSISLLVHSETMGPDYLPPIALEEDKTQNKDTISSQDELKLQDEAKEAVFIPALNEAVADRYDILLEKLSEQSDRELEQAESQSIATIGHEQIQDELTEEQPLELNEPLTIEAVVNNNALLTIDSPAASIPESSLQSIRNFESIPYPEPSSVITRDTKELTSPKIAAIDRKTIKVAEVITLKEQVRALKQVMEASKTSPKAIVKEKASLIKAPELTRRITAIDRQISAKAQDRDNSRREIREDITQPELLEKSRPVVIIRALENLKGPVRTVQTLAENLKMAKQVVSIQDYRSKQPSSIYTAKRTTAAKKASFGEKLNRQRVSQISQLTLNYSDELISDNLSGIRLAA